MARAGSAYFVFEGKDNVSRVARTIGGNLRALNGTASNVARSMARNFAIVGGAISVAGAGIYTAAKSAAEQVDALNAAGVIFGKEGGAAVAKYAENAAFAIGLSNTAALNAINGFGALAKAAGKTGTDAAGFATEMTQLAGDLASFYGGTAEEAAAAIQSALSGTSSEPIRRYNILLSDATLKARAYSMGLIKTTKEALTPQVRVLAAQAEILANSTDAQGDFNKTQDGLKNSILTITSAMQDLVDIFGMEFQDALADVAKQIKDNLPAIKEWVREFAQKLAKELPGIIKGIGDLIPKFVDFIAKVMATAKALWGENGEGPLGQAVSGISGAIGTIADAIAPVLKSLDDLIGKGEEVQNNPVLQTLIAAGLGAAAGKVTGVGGKAGALFAVGASATGGENPIAPLLLALGLGTKGGRSLVGKGLKSMLGFGGGTAAVGESLAGAAAKEGSLLGKILPKVGIKPVVPVAAATGAATAGATAAGSVASGAAKSLTAGGIKSVGKGILSRIPIAGSLFAGALTLAAGGSATEAAGSAIGSGVGTAIGATLGSALGPLGTLAGGFLGGIAGDAIGTAIGGLFNSDPPPPPPIVVTLGGDLSPLVDKVETKVAGRIMAGGYVAL
ncbi:hypothetical protein UFOVP613_36 [uncultured Caudovirales phage]|uniref:Tail tape measure protein n=1 Tax=uncultured Caudovirales phage TaxID=2100421 RepID=A0A6J5N688_9CAUD|nr:hypothetical protein UFOVP613_36 [uncultured Caudovirales phage]